VRIVSKKNWTHGLFIADIEHMPGGICGTWPACELATLFDIILIETQTGPLDRIGLITGRSI
jgi:hypothetical protein